MEEIKKTIKKITKEVTPEIFRIYKYLHQNPELSFQEFKTSEFICSKLKEFGIPYKSGFVKTGIVGKIKGKNSHKRVMALRADMDALPITENSSNPHCSKNKGIMHACGHDMHMASLLGASRILNELKNEWEGTILLIFQPGEELLPGGARRMIDEGAFDVSPEWILAQHVIPDLPTGTVGFRPGIYMASSDEIYLTVKGRGGHAAIPHKITDTVLIASHIIVALQQIVSRHSNATIPTILSFGKIIANGATNVIPNEVSIDGTFRTMNEEWRKEAKKLIRHIAQSTAKGMGGDCDVRIVDGYPFLENHTDITLQAKEWAIDFLGELQVVDIDPQMGAEDFAYYSQEFPATFYRFGIHPPKKEAPYLLHSPDFRADNNALVTGMSLMAWLAVSFLNK